MYKKIDEKDIKYFKMQEFAKRVFVGDKISVDYSHDEMGDFHAKPDVVIMVNTIDEISLIMKYAFENTIPVVVRGSGTGLVGGAVAIYGGILIVTSNMNKILELDEENFTMTCQCGCLISDVAKFADENGYLYPPDPGEKTATIGGNISTNAGGMRAVKYGVTRDYVRSLTCVMTNGDIVEFGSKVVKNSSGYSIKDLIIGSEGTLAIVARATLKILPKPQDVVSVLLPYDDKHTAISAVGHILHSGQNPTAVEYFEKETLQYSEIYLGKAFPNNNYEAYILAMFDDDSVSNIKKAEEIAKLALENGACDALLADTEERKNSIWQSRGAFLEAIKNSTTNIDECDVVVPIGAVGKYLNFVEELSVEKGIRLPRFGHAGDGNLHIYLCRDEMELEDFEKIKADVFEILYDKAKEYKGKVSGEHGIGYSKREYFKRESDPKEIAIMQSIKSVFDPKNILNPEKVI